MVPITEIVAKVNLTEFITVEIAYYPLNLCFLFSQALLICAFAFSNSFHQLKIVILPIHFLKNRLSK